MAEARRDGPVPCPRCREPAQRRPLNPAFPFCSERCRLIDLGDWLDESFRIPGPPDTSDHEP
ncbi:MAG: DNA gyrase inhibitor YacG [Alphaproteobacteria bacterium]|nr:DNA gyrase inhibitor YacG [Alphaproteobacteria bacterium]MCB9795950.1 DNA gyrase inhibitor YacG [Alphaproteobacteria bacterium]